ncbi:TAXI family TRAP transporter solute-binding subunit [Rhodovibrionaceae bacterium A322]
MTAKQPTSPFQTTSSKAAPSDRGIGRRAFFQRLCALTGSAAALALMARGKMAAALDVIFFRIGTGSTVGTYFPIGGALATAISNPPGSRACDEGGSCGAPGVIAVVQSTKGSVENVEGMANGLLESGLSQADVAYWAYHGEGPFEGKAPQRNLRAIANLYPELVQLVVRVDSEIRRIDDLKGKRISLNEVGSGTHVDALIILDAWGLTPDDLEARYLSTSDAIEQVRLGDLDGFFLIAGAPTQSISDLAEETQLRLVPVDGKEAKGLRDRYPFFASHFLQAGTYQAVSGVETLSVGAQWLVRAEEPEEVIYEITKALWHNNTRPILDRGHAKGRQIRFPTALDGLGIPLHPGARRYYEEKGVTVIEDVPPSD